ncbi:MAG: DUF58 domain-containing protein [Planctomycetota bacterium]
MSKVVGHRGCGLRRVRGRWTVGPGGLVYVMLTGVLGAGAWYTQANLLFWAVGLMIGGLVASVGWVVLTLRKVSVERMVPEQAVAGEATVLRYRLQNRSRLPVFALSITEVWRKGDGTEDPVRMRPRRLKGAPMGWVLHLAPRSAGVAESTCWPLRRGRLRFDRVRLTTSFPFGVLGRWVEFEGTGGSSSVLVYPTIYPLSKRLAFRAWSMTGGLEDSVQQGGREGEVIGMRGYRPGDPERSIDWKRTARTGRLISREYGRPMPPLAMIELDLTPPGALRGGASGGLRALVDGSGRGGRDGQRGAEGEARDEAWFAWLTRAESAIALSASLIHDAYVRGYRVGLAVRGAAGRAAGGVWFEPKHAASHLALLLDTLAEVEVHSGAASAGTDAVGAGNGSGRRGTLRVVAASAGQGLGEGLSGGSAGGRRLGGGMGGGDLVGRARGRVPVLVPEDLERIAGGGTLRPAVPVGLSAAVGGGNA